MKSKLAYVSMLILVLFSMPLLNSCGSHQSKSGPQTPANYLPQPTHEFGLPAYTFEDEIIRHTAYTLKYRENCEQAEWVAYKLTAERASGTYSRTNDFRPDPMVETGSAELSDYRNSGYDRGHLAPAADMAWSPTVMSESFFMSNMSPQRPNFNRGIWKRLEQQVRNWAKRYKEIYIVTGPVLPDNLPTIGPNRVAVPNYFYKVILDLKPPEVKGIGFVLANQGSYQGLKTYAVTIDSVETLTGIKNFPDLPDPLEMTLESRIESAWTFDVTSTPPKEITAPPPKKPPQEKDVTVYITRTGKKYHRGSCGYLHSSRIAISKSQAIRRGYTPCSRCRP